MRYSTLHRRTPPRATLHPDIGRGWNHYSKPFLTPGEAMYRARQEWADNFDDAHRAFIDEATYIRFRTKRLCGFIPEILKQPASNNTAGEARQMEIQ